MIDWKTIYLFVCLFYSLIYCILYLFNNSVILIYFFIYLFLGFVLETLPISKQKGKQQPQSRSEETWLSWLSDGYEYSVTFFCLV